MTTKPKFDSAKFRELMLYAAEQSVNDEYFGALKLNKILFFSDFLSFGLTGAAMTGATYVREKNGPVPRQLLPIQREIEQRQDGIVRARPLFNHIQKRLIALRPANLNVFSGDEVDLVNDVIRNLAPLTGSEASQLSHERSFAWQIAEMGEEIPYTAVFLSARKATTSDIERGRELAAQHGWLRTAR